MDMVVSLDIHRDFSKAIVMDKEFTVIGEERISHAGHHHLSSFFRHFARGTDVVMEATFNWPWIADLAESCGLAPHLAHAQRARQYARGMAKSDRKDAVFLARLWLSGDLFPHCYLAPPSVRRRRSFFRQRLLLVRMRTGLKNAVHGQLFRLGYRLSAQVSDLFGRGGRALLSRLRLPEHERLLLDEKLTAIDETSEHIRALERVIFAELQADADGQLLLSMPGVGPITAYTLLAEIGQIGRFANGRALAAYAGLLPLANESADSDHGRRTGRWCCNRYLRWAAIEAVSGAVRGSPRMRSLHSRVRARNKRMPGKARVAVARQLMETVWLLLTRRRRYQENPPGRAERSSAGRRRTSQTRASQTPLSARSPRGNQAAS